MIEKTIDEVNFPPLEILILDEAQDFNLEFYKFFRLFKDKVLAKAA